MPTNSTHTIQRTVDKIIHWWFRPYSVAYIRVFEFVLCLVMMYYFGTYALQMDWWVGEKGFHPSAAATSSHYLAPPPRPSAEWFSSIVMCFYFLCGLYLMGYGRRLLNWVFFALAVYVQAMDQASSFTINRMLIMYFLMLGLQPTTMVVKGEEMISGWLIRVIQLTVTIQYTASGFCKMNGDWLKRLDIIWTQSQGHYKNELAAWAVNDLPMPIWWALAIFTLVFETGAVLFFFWKRTRMLTVISGVLLHLGIAILMKDLIFFSVQMISAYVVFLPVAIIQVWHDRLTRVLTSQS